MSLDHRSKRYHFHSDRKIHFLFLYVSEPIPELFPLLLSCVPPISSVQLHPTSQMVRFPSRSPSALLHRLKQYHLQFPRVAQRNKSGQASRLTTRGHRLYHLELIQALSIYYGNLLLLSPFRRSEEHTSQLQSRGQL